VLELERNYDTMSNMKDYMMWLDDKGIAKWDTVIGELIIPEGTNIYAEELMELYEQDAVWRGDDVPPHFHDPDDDDMLDDEDDGLLDDDDLGDSYINPQHLPHDSAAQYHLDFIGELL
jgi:hypothetical protein